jgi:hypothetical protein
MRKGFSDMSAEKAPFSFSEEGAFDFHTRA